MSFADWQDRFSVGIEAIDNEHKILFDLIGQLHDAYAADKPVPDLERVFAILMDYVATHFENERQLFVRIGYPAAIEHVTAHDRFANEVSDLFARFRAGEGEKIYIELLGLLNNWWHFHVQEEDAAFCRFLADKGLTA